MGSAGRVERSNEESVQARVYVCNKKWRLRGREYCTSMSFYVLLYYSVDFILKEMRSYAESPSFNSLPTL